jgi:ankyrin repeat protein
VEAAIEAGAHINGRLSGETDADSGQTAIIKAVRLGCLEVLDLLLQKGADPYVKDDLHRDAWYYACFGINIKDGDHQTLMSLMLMYWELEQDVLLLAMHSPHPGVRREVRLASVN